MKMDLIQPFLNSADTVVAEIMGCNVQITDVSMDKASQRQEGIAAMVAFIGEIEGRAILDMDQNAARHAAVHLLGGDPSPADSSTHEAICEVTNMIIGNAVTQLNDRGFRFKVYPPEIYSSAVGLRSTPDTEALVLRFETPHGNMVLNIAMQYGAKRVSEVPVLSAT
jgi:chemotaxis protein CheX